MLNVGYFRQGFAIGVTMLIRRIFPVIAAMVMLRLAMVVYDVPLSDAYVALMIISGLLAFILFPPRGANEFYIAESTWGRAISTALSWASLFAILLFLGYATKTSEIFSRRVLMTWFVVTPLVILAGRTYLSSMLSRLMVSAKSKRQAVVAGVNSIALSLAENIASTPNFGIVIDGFFEDRSRERLGVGIDIPILGQLTELPNYVRQHKTDIIFIAMPIKNVQRVTELLDDLHDTTASIYFVPDVMVFDLIQCRTVEIKGIPAISLCETPFYGFRGVAKRVSDIVIASVALILTSPIMLVTAILIKATSEGSVVFKQRRYGLDGREIVVYKFRTMTVSEDRDEVKQATRDDGRLTPIGGFLRRYSIDELPQFINVLQGRMSIVGPRPHAVAHNEEYRKVIKGYMVRHKVAPGITGLAQVSGYRGETETVEKMQRRIELDLEYLRHWSLTLDIRIIFKTIAIVFSDKAAY
jgi:putative colanic acid biosysnthesis UDP-glucose lipid carrier transferase